MITGIPSTGICEPITDVIYYPYRDICWYRGYYLILTPKELIISPTPHPSGDSLITHEGTKYQRVFSYLGRLYLLLTTGYLRRISNEDDFLTGSPPRLTSDEEWTDRYDHLSVSHDGLTLRGHAVGDSSPPLIMGSHHQQYAIRGNPVTIYDGEDVFTIDPVDDLVILPSGDLITLHHSRAHTVRYCHSEIYYLI